MQNEIHKKMQSGFHTGQKCHKVAPTRKTGGSTDGYKPLMLGQRLKALAFALLQPLCF